ncbi:hypothetical protein [Thermococcus sp. CX2]|uniref:hypothetical protein n=1 Tax=Thermococcus sp. CX2 TaxID=163006 RepID=UPI00353043BB
MGMEDILVPKERRDAVVFIGVDRGENVEFVKVYAVSEEVAARTLEEFFNAKGLFPSDFFLVDKGVESLKGKGAITTRSETGLSAKLSRLGLRLLSNGVLYTEGLESVYQLTLVSERLLGEFQESEKAKRSELTKLKLLTLGESTLVENLRDADITAYLPEGVKFLREPPVERVAELLAAGETVVVETKDAGRYERLGFSIFIRIPPLSPEEFAEAVSEELGFRVDPGIFERLPPHKRGYYSAKAIARLAKKLRVRTGREWEELLRLAVRIHLGEV